jgi:hypothetical protein
MMLREREPVPIGLRIPVEVRHGLALERREHLLLELAGGALAAADPGELGEERPVALVSAKEHQVGVALLLDEVHEVAERADLPDGVTELGLAELAERALARGERCRSILGGLAALAVVTRWMLLRNRRLR